MNKNKPYYANEISRMLSSVIPNEFRMVNDPTSNGYKLSNLLYGVDVDHIYDYMSQALHYNKLDTFDYGIDDSLYSCTIKNNIINDEVYGENNTPIKITTREEFYDGEPTRVSDAGELVVPVSGVKTGPIGIEYFRNSPEGSGFFLINIDTNIENSLSLEQESPCIKLYVDDLGEPDFDHISGINRAIFTQDYDTTGTDEVLHPDTKQVLREKYPTTRTVYLPESGIFNRPLRKYTVEHITPEPNYIWDSSEETYKPVHYNSSTYYDEHDNKLYHKTALNNPNGSGVYDTVYIKLEHVPISGSLKLYDLDNLSESGTLVEIGQEENGTTLYYHSGVYTDFDPESIQPSYPSGFFCEYIGYSETVPTSYLPVGYNQAVFCDPYENKIISWQYVREGSGLNDKFQWVDATTTNITNMIKINNPYSRYIVEYKYKGLNKEEYITTTYATKYVRLDNGTYIMSSKNLNNNEVSIESTPSNDPNRQGITFDGLAIRPGTIINRLELSADVEINSTIINNNVPDNNTFTLENKHAGYSEKICPKFDVTRDYLFNYPKVDEISVSGNIDNNIITTIMYDNMPSTRIIHLEDEIWLNHEEYINCVSPDNSDNKQRIIQVRFNLNNFIPTNNKYNIIQSWNFINNNSQYWSLYIENNGTLVFNDSSNIYKSYNTLRVPQTDITIIIRDNDKINTNDLDYSFYYKLGNLMTKKIEMYEDNYAIPENIITDYNNTKGIDFFKNTSVDIHSIMIYDQGINTNG